MDRADVLPIVMGIETRVFLAEEVIGYQNKSS